MDLKIHQLEERVLVKEKMVEQSKAIAADRYDTIKMQEKHTETVEAQIQTHQKGRLSTSINASSDDS